MCQGPSASGRRGGDPSVKTTRREKGARLPGQPGQAEGGRYESKARDKAGVSHHMKRGVWEFVRNEDGSFDMFREGARLHKSVPRKWFEDQMGRYGFCGREYEDILREIDEHGRCEITL